MRNRRGRLTAVVIFVSLVSAGALKAETLQGTVNAVVIFAGFQGEAPADTLAPPWAEGFFDPEKPGSFSHFYDQMSFGRLRVRGEVSRRRYASLARAEAYLPINPNDPGRYGAFALEILTQADGDIDFSRFDNDGADGIPNSGDDDGAVDAVFLVLSSTPRNFLVGGATGVQGLDLGSAFITDDEAVDGSPIRIDPALGALQRGRSFAEAVGSAAHEYGHMLGLKDLYNKSYVAGDSPGEDSAGIGRWGLMGWGALGWRGDDGPTSLSAWSRQRLGWLRVDEMRTPELDLRLADVGSGSAFKVRLTALDYFLLEYRRRDSSYYDRNLPAEGLLIWHVRHDGSYYNQLGFEYSSRVDLVCADGRWLDAGYPLGTQADPLNGADNLDFWSHDAAYTRAHGGNLGDETDPFDGTRFDRFTPESNPSSASEGSPVAVRVEGIRFRDGVMEAHIQIPPLRLAVTDFDTQDSGDGVLMVGADFRVHFSITNQGGLRAPDVRTTLRTSDPFLELIEPETAFGDLELGMATDPVEGRNGFPQVRFRPGFHGAHTAELVLDVYTDGALVAQHAFSLTGLSPVQLQDVIILNDRGNRDGQVQAAEIFQLQLTLDYNHPELLSIFQFYLRPLLKGVVVIGDTFMSFNPDGSWAKDSAPAFMAPSELAPGTEIPFEFEVSSPFRSRYDTLQVVVAPGGDLTAPFVLAAKSWTEENGIRIALTEDQFFEADQLRSATALIYSVEDTTEIASVVLSTQDGRLGGLWVTERGGEFLLRTELVDGSGNTGTSPFQQIFANPVRRLWDTLRLSDDPLQPVVRDVAFAPGDASTAYALTQSALWRSTNRGDSWTRVGYMNPLFNKAPAPSTVGIDAVDPQTVYIGNRRSRDGGQSWAEMDGIAMAVDPVRAGRLYSVTADYNPDDRLLQVSADWGHTWRTLDTRNIPDTRSMGDSWSGRLTIHPANTDILYYSQRQLSRSTDGGRTWAQTNGFWQAIQPDPADELGVFGLRDNELHYSSDAGESWRVLRSLGGLAWQIKAYAQGILVWGDVGELLRSGDSGVEEVTLPPLLDVPPGDRTMTPFIDPRDTRRMFLSLAEGPRRVFMKTDDGGRSWRQITFPAIDSPAGALVFDAAGSLYVGSGGRPGADGRAHPGIYSSSDGNRSWKWQSSNVYVYRDAVFRSLLVDRRNGIWLGMAGNFADMAARVWGDWYDILRSVDGGRSWSTTGGGYFLTPPFSPPKLLKGADGYFTGGSLEGLSRSSDGETWEYFRDDFEAVTSFTLNPADGRRVYAATNDNTLMLSVDSGRNWELLEAGHFRETIFELSFNPSATRLYAVTSDEIHQSSDQGRTWSLLSTLERAAGTRTSVAYRLRFHPSDPGRMYLFSSNVLLSTTDAGATWQSIGEDLAGRPWFNDVAVDPANPELLYVATPWGVYRSSTTYDETSVADETQGTRPEEFQLYQNYPNPFNPSTAIRFDLGRPEKIDLALYNLAGQKVATLAQGHREAGTYNLRWDGRDENGRELASGVYLYRLQAGSLVETRKLLLLR